MKPLVLIISLLVFTSVALAHGAKRAYFDLVLDKAAVELIVTIEEDDLSVVLKKKKLIAQGAPRKTVMTQIPSFIEKHFKLSVNGTEAKPELKDVSYGNRHFKLFYSFGIKPKDLSSVELWTDYLNEDFKEHLNVFRLEWQGKKKFYQLHSGRQTIEHKFK